MSKNKDVKYICRELEEMQELCDTILLNQEELQKDSDLHDDLVLKVRQKSAYLESWICWKNKEAHDDGDDYDKCMGPEE